MKATIPTSMNMSPTAVTAPDAKISASVSMSFVIRVTTRPIGVRSK